MLFTSPPCVTICHQLCVTTACHCSTLEQMLRTHLFREHHWRTPSNTGHFFVILAPFTNMVDSLAYTLQVTYKLNTLPSQTVSLMSIIQCRCRISTWFANGHMCSDLFILLFTDTLMQCLTV